MTRFKVGDKVKVRYGVPRPASGTGTVIDISHFSKVFEVADPTSDSREYVLQFDDGGVSRVNGQQIERD